MSTATPGSSVVIDASAAIRAAVDRDDGALQWFARIQRGELDAVWPELALVEIANGLLRLLRVGSLPAGDAFGYVADFLAAPVKVEPFSPLIVPALDIGIERNLSVYDATYVVLAESLDAKLVTADRRLAEATDNSVLVGG